MAEIVKTAPYEILLRFTCDIGEKCGLLRGAHYVMETYLVDASDLIVGRIDTGAKAAEFPVEKLVEFLGERFVEFDKQLKQERAARRAAEQRADEAERRRAG